MVAGAGALARSIMGATGSRLSGQPSGMGHDLPRGLWPLLSDVIAANARRAAASGGEPATLHRLGELGQDVGELQ